MSVGALAHQSKRNLACLVLFASTVGYQILLTSLSRDGSSWVWEEEWECFDS